MHTTLLSRRRSFAALALLALSLVDLACAVSTPSPSLQTWASLPPGDAYHPSQYEQFWPSSPLLQPRGAAPTEVLLRLNDAVLHLDELAPQTGPTGVTVLLLHGGGGHGRLLLPFALPLAKAGYRVVVPDLPAHGLSHAEGTVTFDRWVQWVSLLVDREQAAGQRVVLFGLSLGGTTAWHVAAENPHVAGVIATTLLDLRHDDARAATASGPLSSHVFAPLAIALPWLLDGVPVRAGDVGKMQAMSPSSSLVRRLAQDPYIGGVMMPAAFYRTLMTRTPARPITDSALPPLLVVHPGADQWTPVALSRPQFEQWGGDKTMVVLDGGAHLPWERAAFEQLATAVVTWLATTVIALP